jgi:hypothetical protein
MAAKMRERGYSMYTAWMINNDGTATPVKQHVYGSADDLDENMSAACFLYEHADMDLLRFTISGCYYVWAASVVYRHFKDKEIPEEYDWREGLQRAVDSLPYKVLDWGVTVPDVLLVSHIITFDHTGTEQYPTLASVIAKFKEKYADYTGQEVNRELNQAFIRARFGGRYDTEPNCHDNACWCLFLHIFARALKTPLA